MAEGTGLAGHERRRTRPQGIGRRLADRSVALETRLAQERRRLAADVHDLIMQDVSFALARTRAIAADPELAGRHAEDAVAAAERALAGARAIMSGLVEREQRPIA
jgi:signal transduction histidine kinase